MTNQERRDKVKQLRDLIYPLNQEKLMTLLRYNALKSRHQENKAANPNPVEELGWKLQKLHAQLVPLFENLRKTQVAYQVEYDGEVIRNGTLTTVFNSKTLWLATAVKIDTHQEEPDYGNEDVQLLIQEITDYIYQQEYSDFTLQHIKRLY